MNESQEGMAPSGGLTGLQGLLCFSYFDFEFCVQMDDESLVYSGYLKWKENGERNGNISSHGPKKLTCQKKKRKVPHALNFVFNKFTLSWETRVLRETTFVTFLCSWICLSNSESLTAGALSAERRSSVWIKGGLFMPCLHVVDHQLTNDLFVTLFKLKFGHPRILLAPVSLCRDKYTAIVSLQRCGL